MIEEWCATAPDRFIPIIIVPLWDPQLAADEVRRCAAMGNRAITFSEQPEALGLPTIWDSNRHWDPLWAACDETQTVVCTHIGSSSQVLTISNDTPYWVSWSWGASARVAATVIDWLFSPVFRRFPGVEIALSEGGIGWMPYFLERAQQVIDNQGSVLAAGTQVGSGPRARTGG